MHTRMRTRTQAQGRAHTHTHPKKMWELEESNRAHNYSFLVLTIFVVPLSKAATCNPPTNPYLFCITHESGVFGCQDFPSNCRGMHTLQKQIRWTWGFCCRWNVEHGTVTPTKRGVRNADPEKRHRTATKMTFGVSKPWNHGVTATWRNCNVAAWRNCDVATCYVH